VTQVSTKNGAAEFDYKYRRKAYFVVDDSVANKRSALAAFTLTQNSEYPRALRKHASSASFC